MVVIKSSAIRTESLLGSGGWWEAALCLSVKLKQISQVRDDRSVRLVLIRNRQLASLFYHVIACVILHVVISCYSIISQPFIWFTCQAAESFATDSEQRVGGYVERARSTGKCHYPDRPG